MSALKKLAILGSTGSIGTQALDVLRHHPQKYQLLALAAGHQLERLIPQIIEFQPRYVSVANDALRQELQWALKHLSFKTPLDIFTTDAGGLGILATLPDVTDVLMGVVGILGLSPSLSALKAGKTLLTANKETFVAGGHLVQPYLSQVLPFDSEHSALFQSLHHAPTSRIKKMWITASGGPFRGYSQEALKKVSKAEALRHPKWVMGEKVTIDSATLMNKGLELIEAHWLFEIEAQRLDVLIHPQSIVHGLVEFIDGSIIAQMAPADMRIPIQVAMSWPDRWSGAYRNQDFNILDLARLDFEAPDENTFPCLALAREALKRGSLATTVLNAADEVAVQAFLDERIRFTQIPQVIEHTLLESSKKINNPSLPPLEDILEEDRWARRESQGWIQRL
ncbi:MAG: 1-deoxy-D-xylulose-5-phosphate reductoisomerase [Vampirovibrio sp.]